METVKNYSTDKKPKVKYDWKFIIKINMCMLRLIGMWPKDNEIYKFNFYTLYNIICINLFVNVHTFFQIMDIILGSTNLETLAGTIFLTSSELLVSVKALYFIKNIENLKKILSSLDSELFQPRNFKHRTIAEQDMQFWKLMYYAFWGSAGSVLILFSILPLLQKTVTQYPLPFDTWYPYDTKISPFYEITYLHQVFSLWLMVIVTVNIDTLMAALMTYIGIQCDILCDILRNLNFVHKKINSFNINLIRCIQHHKEILSFSKRSNEFISFLVLGQLFTTSLAIALTLFRLSLVEPLSSEMIILLCYALSAITQVFIYCWFGKVVETKSSRMAYSAFESDWTGIPVEMKKNLIVFIMMSQKPIVMSAINLFPLSLATFTTILRSSWSYFAVLRTVNSPK